MKFKIEFDGSHKKAPICGGLLEGSCPIVVCRLELKRIRVRTDWWLRNRCAYFYRDQYPSDGASDKNSATRLRLNELVEVVAIATPPTDDAEQAPVLSAPQQGNLNDMLSLFQNDDLEESMADHNRLPLWHVLWFRRTTPHSTTTTSISAIRRTLGLFTFARPAWR